MKKFLEESFGLSKLGYVYITILVTPRERIIILIIYDVVPFWTKLKKNYPQGKPHEIHVRRNRKGKYMSKAQA